MAATLHSLASVLEAQGRYGEAEKLLREVLETYMRIYKTGEHLKVVVALNNLAHVLEAQGQYEEAENFFARC